MPGAPAFFCSVSRFTNPLQRCLWRPMRPAARAIIAHTLAVTATPQFRSWMDDGGASSPPRELQLAIPWSEPWPWRGLTDSVFVHAALLGLLYAVSIWPQAGVHLADSRSFRRLHDYQISQYLPELHGAPTHRHHGGKADPVLARQPIQSLPDAPDNLHQTIVAPRGPRLRHDVDLPNLVAYDAAFQPPLSAQPLQAIARSTPLQLTGSQPSVPGPCAGDRAAQAPARSAQRPARRGAAGAGCGLDSPGKRAQASRSCCRRPPTRLSRCN